MTTTHSAIGQPWARVDGAAKVTGSARYAADVNLPGQVWAKLVRSPLPHALIKGIDATEARSLPGVLAVLTADDLPKINVGRMIKDLPALAGERIAIVIAEDEELAQRAVDLVLVDFDELPAATDLLAAQAPGAPVIHPGLDSYEVGPVKLWTDGHPKTPDDPPNMFARWIVERGDIDKGFAGSDRIFEHTFTLPRTHQGYMERHSCIVAISDDGRVQVWAGNKQPHALRRQLAEYIGTEMSQIRINTNYIGGDFGGKSSPMDVPLAYFAAKAVGRPVKMVMTYSEELQAANLRHPAIITIKSGVKNDGTLVARDAVVAFNSGAYTAFKPLANIPGFSIGGVYRIPNVRLENRGIYTNSVPGGHSRSPGDPQGIFAVESHTDLIAQGLGMSPLEFRRKNVLVEGDTAPGGHKWQAVELAETLERAAAAIGFDTPKAGPNIGRGLAVFDHPTGFGNTSATVGVNPDGTATVYTPFFDQGTGTHTVVMQIAAEELGLGPAEMRVVHIDTDNSVPDSGVGNSRATHIAGQATMLAARQARERLLELASEMLEAPTGSLTLGDAHVTSSGGAAIAVSQVAAEAARRGTYLSGYAEYKSTEPDVTSFTTQAAEVEVDPASGQVTVRRFVTVVDSGTIINPIAHRGQINGGYVTGLGYALMEEVPQMDGRAQAVNLHDYKLPSIGDITPLEVLYLEGNVAGPTPYAGKSVGETHNPPVAAAIANAVADAVGARLMELPLTAERIHDALAGEQ